MKLRTVVTVVLVSLTLIAPASAVVTYVKWDSPGPTFDGRSWDTAFHTIQEGLDRGREVWVAAGTYREQVWCRSGTALYGGFAGNEVERNQRDWRANVTIIDGNQASRTVHSTFRRAFQAHRRRD